MARRVLHTEVDNPSRGLKVGYQIQPVPVAESSLTAISRSSEPA